MQSAFATSAHEPPHEAFHAFYREHYGFVWHVVARFGVASAEQGDAVQDTFVTAYRRHDGMHGAAPRSWLYGIARRVASNYRRGAGRASRKHSALAGAGAANVSPALADALIVLDRFLDGQSDRDRELFVLSEVVGWSGQEIAETTGIEARIVYARLRLLRRQLAEHVPEGTLASLSRVRTETPRASERGWLALVSGLGQASEGTAASVASSWLAKIGIGVAVAGVTVGVATMSSRPEPPRPIVPATIEAPPSTEPAAIASPPATHRSMPAATPEPAPVVRAAVKPPAVAAAPDDALARDNARLAEILDAIEADPARALELLTSHAREFPNSPQADVRSALRIDALCRLGRTDEGRREAAAFDAAHPGSPARRRAHRACEAR